MLMTLAVLLAAGSASDELFRLTRQRCDANAVNDRAFYQRLLAPNFVMMEPHGVPPWTKQAYLDAEFPAGRPPRPKSTISGFDAHVDGDTAVVSYQLAEPYPIGGDQRFESRSHRLDTYARIGGAWRLLSMAVAVPASWPEAAALDPRLYDEYAGTYELSPETRVVVTHEAGRLMAQVTGQEKVELFPESTTSFFDRTDSPLARTVFERDASGQVVAQVYRALGQQLRARKIR
jgi:Domain of unknown function (DUF4440)/Domain of unknown function (DUF3471)